MTDRIRSEFEVFARKNDLNIATTGGRYNAPVVSYMWLAWQHQADMVADMAAEVERLNVIISRLSVEGQDAVEM